MANLKVCTPKSLQKLLFQRSLVELLDKKEECQPLPPRARDG
jgi:hypothetical protein